ncbi:J domain-containing protein [Kocuria soli]|uniref:J domain-containing protein n=1 Tax=Kocuria soli TaxID=2485125 RepID=A0A3N3ZM74_9MICC|nr:J domain-containing protein [Kocuria soli]ROZ61750.1 J domain-containing protein [Kocuria soli]
MTAQDHYQVLGVARTASQDEIKRAYRRAMRRNHTDVGGSAEETVKINLARDTLANPLKRKEYDAALACGEKPEPGQATKPSSQEPKSASPAADPPPASRPSWGRRTSWDGSTPPKGQQRRMRRPVGHHSPQPGTTEPGGSHWRDAPGSVAPDINDVTWPATEGPIRVSKGRPKWLQMSRRTTWTVAAIMAWTVWALLPLLLSALAALVTPPDVSGLSGGISFLVLMCIPLGGILVTRGGCLGNGFHFLGALLGLAIVAGALLGDSSLSNVVVAIWVGIGLVLYLAAGRLWAKPGPRLPRDEAIHESDLLNHSHWGQMPLSPLVGDPGLDAACRYVSHLIQQLRTRIPGVRYVLRLGTGEHDGDTRIVPFAVIAHRRIALVYATVATNGTVSWDRRCVVEQAPSGSRDVILEDITAVPGLIRRFFPEARVRTWVVVVPYPGARPSVPAQRGPHAISLVDGAGFLESCGAWLAKGETAVVRQDLVSRLAQLSRPLSWT